MPEGIPSAPKAQPEPEVIQEEREWISNTNTPEYWEPRKEVPFSRSYTDFQVAVARELSKKSGRPMSEIGRDYTTMLQQYVRPDLEDMYIDVDTMSDEDIAVHIFEHESRYSEAQSPTPYHEYTRFGCFMYHAHAGSEQKGRVDIHFSNAEFDETGPLGKDKIERRLHELKDIFTELHRNWPEAEFVRGDSWLYNLEAYKRLFPEAYTAHPEIDTSPDVLATGRAWGQFADNKLELKKELADTFLENIRNLAEITPDTVREALPYQVLINTAPIEEFYKKYNII